MNEHYQNLISMLNHSPNFDLCSGYSALSSMLSKYLTVLNYYNSYNEDYKGATTQYYVDISSIRDYIEESVYATTPEIKKAAFQKAKNELTANIEALATLIRKHEMPVQATA